MDADVQLGTATSVARMPSLSVRVSMIASSDMDMANHLDRQEGLVCVVRIFLVEPGKHLQITERPILAVKFAFDRRESTMHVKLRAIVLTAVQDHLCAGRQSVDTALDRIKRLLVGYRGVNPIAL